MMELKLLGALLLFVGSSLLFSLGYVKRVDVFLLQATLSPLLIFEGLRMLW